MLEQNVVLCGWIKICTRSKLCEMRLEYADGPMFKVCFAEQFNIDEADIRCTRDTQRCRLSSSSSTNYSLVSTKPAILLYSSIV